VIGIRIISNKENYMVKFLEDNAAERLEDAASAINDCFDWGSTDQRPAFWSDLYARLRALAREAEAQGYAGKNQGIRVLKTAVPVPPDPVVHVMYENVVCCSTVQGRPHEWEAHHTQVPIDALDKATCVPCYEFARNILMKRKTPTPFTR
jgi:hypothetical protein